MEETLCPMGRYQTPPVSGFYWYFPPDGKTSVVEVGYEQSPTPPGACVLWFPGTEYEWRLEECPGWFYGPLSPPGAVNDVDC